MANKHSDLYLTPPEFSKVAGSNMPPDTELWSQSVFTVFSEDWPDLADLSGGDVEWNKDAPVDEEYGFGIGTITVNSGSAIIKIPIVVKDYKLLPIDIFESDGKMQLLNKENIGAALKGQDSVGSVSYPDKTDFKTTRFVDWLSKGATEDGWKERVSNLTKIAKKIGVGPYLDKAFQNFVDIPIKSTETGASVIYFENNDKLGHLSMVGYANGKVVQMGPVRYSDPGFSKNKNLKEASTVAFNQGYSICPIGKIKKANVGYLGVDATKDLGLIDKPGVYGSQAIVDAGIENAVVFAMNILPLGQEELAENPRMGFVVQGKDDLNYALQEDAVGKAQPSSKFDFSGSTIPLNSANRYDKGFILYDKDGDITQCSGLVTIDRISQTPKGRMSILMKTSQGDVQYLLDEAFTRILPLASDDILHSAEYNLNLTGPNLSFLRVAEPVELVSSLDKHQSLFDDAIVKNAANTSSMTVRYIKDTNKISAKLGNEQYEDSPERFMARMFSLGIPPENTATLISHIKEASTPIQIVGIIPDKEAETVLDHKDVLDLMSDLDGMRGDIIKAAAVIESSGGDDQAAAAVLGIGMIGEENLRYFLQVIPTLDDVSNILAKMLYSARIGDIQIDEGAVKSALVNITQIIGKLKAISARI